MFGQLLIDPTFLEVKAAISAALRQASSPAGERNVPIPPEIREELPGLWKAPEGWQIWKLGSRGAAVRVGVAWWSDPTGRRHFRVGGAPRRDHDSRRFFAEWEGLEPSARVHPERSYLLGAGTAPRLTVTCDCGLGGLPAALSWVGQCCGPCYDRYLESGVDVILDPRHLSATHVQLEQPAHVLTVSPDGRRLATAARGEPFRLWEVPTGREILDGAEHRCAV